LAVDQAFSRLAKADKVLRVTLGTYAAPVSSRFGLRPKCVTGRRVKENLHQFLRHQLELHFLTALGGREGWRPGTDAAVD
jgi:hypothetical protein